MVVESRADCVTATGAASRSATLRTAWLVQSFNHSQNAQQHDAGIAAKPGS